MGVDEAGDDDAAAEVVDGLVGVGVTHRREAASGDDRAVPDEDAAVLLDAQLAAVERADGVSTTVPR